MNSELERMVIDLHDREAIRDVIYRYCHALDRGDLTDLKAVFWPDATDNHGLQDASLEEFMAAASELIDKNFFEQTHHMIGNILIRKDGNRATSESYFYAYHRLAPKTDEHPDWSGRTGDGLSDYFMSGRYLDVMEKRGDTWRIQHRKVVLDWWRPFEGSADWSIGVSGVEVPVGLRSPEDPSYALFGSSLRNGGV